MVDYARRCYRTVITDGGSTPPASTILQGSDLRQREELPYNSGYNMSEFVR
jgi:hypothetical protein